MHANESPNQTFLGRAVERGLLTYAQADELRLLLDGRRQAEPNLSAYELAIERGMVSPDAARNLLDDAPAQALDPDVRWGSNTAELEPEDDHFTEVPKLVDSAPPSYAVVDGESGESHLEMELPPPDLRSGDSLFEDRDSRQLPTLDTDDGAPSAAEDTAREPLLDDLNIDDVEDEEVLVADQNVEDLRDELPVLDALSPDIDEEGILTADPRPTSSAGSPGSTSLGITGIRPGERGDSPETTSLGITGVRAGKKRPDGDTAHGDEASPAPPPKFEMRGSKGALDDFASFGDEPAIEEIEESQEDSDEISGRMHDSAVNEVMEQADDGYFGPPVDLTTTPQEIIEDSIAPAGPLSDSTLFDSEKLRAEAQAVGDQDDQDFSASIPPIEDDTAETPHVLDEESDVHIVVATGSTFPSQVGVEDDLPDLELHDTGKPTTGSGVSTGSRTQFATGEGGHAGLGTGSKLGVESGVTGDEKGEEIVGHEMTLSALRAKMGLGAGVKLGQSDSAASGRFRGGARRRYRVIREIARGGMGKVIEVEDNDLRRSVALKILRKEMLGRRDLVERFLEEAQITGQLEHPNIVPVHEIGVDGRGNLYFTMKLVEGEELSSILKRLRKQDPGAISAYPIARLVDIFIKVCEGVAFAHSRGVIHRDLKPANIMVGRFGEVQIMDWGVAKIIGRKEDAVERSVASDRHDGDAAKTIAGSVLGTPSYMSPEQARGEINNMGPASDIFSLGVILYELLALVTPWSGQTSAQVMDQVKNQDPDPPSVRAPQERKVPPELDQLVMKCLAKEPHQRIGSVEELIDNLRSWQSGGTLAAVEYTIGQLIGKWVARRKGLVAAVLIVLVALVGGAVVTTQHLKREELKRVDGMISAADGKLADARRRLNADEYESAESLARDAYSEYTAAFAINPDSQPAREGQFEAGIVVAAVQAALRDLREQQAERERRERDMQLLREALLAAREQFENAKTLAADDQTDPERASEEFAGARAAFQRVQSLDEANFEARAAINEIDEWQRDYRARVQAEQELRRMRSLLAAAREGVRTADGYPQEEYERAGRALMNVISLCDQAIAMPLQTDEAERMRHEALGIKATAALSFAGRAIALMRFEVAELMLDLGASTGRNEAAITAARENLNRRVREQSRFLTLMRQAEQAVAERDWGVAVTRISLALDEARESEYATDGDRLRLARMFELARLEDIHARESNATSPSGLLRLHVEYTELLPALTDAEYAARAARYQAEVAGRVSDALVREAEAAEDPVVAIGLYERALPFTSDPARNAEIRGRLADLKLRLVMARATDEFVLLPRGAFVVGSNREGDQNPQQQIEHEGFVFIDRHLVTNAEYQRFVDAGGYVRPELWHEDARPYLSQLVDSTGSPGPATWIEGGFDPSLANYPVTGVSWYEAAAYAKWAKRRLPTPAEWEIAAGAPRPGKSVAGMDYPFGTRAEAPPEGVREPREVGTADWDGNALGVRDMGANVAEWTAALDETGRAIVKGAEPGLRPELYFRYARRAKNSVARLLDRSPGRGFRCAHDFSADAFVEPKDEDGKDD